MPTFKISYAAGLGLGDSDTVTADGYVDKAPFIDFTVTADFDTETVLRVRQEHVQKIERIAP